MKKQYVKTEMSVYTVKTCELLSASGPVFGTSVNQGGDWSANGKQADVPFDDEEDEEDNNDNKLF